MQVAADLTSQASHDNVLVVFGGLLLVMLLAALDSTIAATALPTIVGEFGGLAHPTTGSVLICITSLCKLGVLCVSVVN